MHLPPPAKATQQESQSPPEDGTEIPQDSTCCWHQTERKDDRDVTGRKRLVSNVLFSWLAYSTFLIGGFVLPRMIDHRLGQESLGIWDFAWSLVGYFSLVQMGISSSVNRFVAQCNTSGDIAGINRVVNSATCVLGAAGLLVVGMTIAFSLLLPRLFEYRLGASVPQAQWLVLFLGVSIAVQMASGAFNGVLTGCHHWGLHNLNSSGWYTAIVAGIVVALLLGGGLCVSAAIVLAGETLSAARRGILAHRVCQGLRLHPSLVQWATIKDLFAFGAKTLIPSVSNLFLNQTTSILMMAYLGPVALTLYARPRSLILHVQTIINKMAMTLTPTTSSLQSIAGLREIQTLAIRAAQYSLYLSLPVVLTLVIFGGPVMQLWMGPRYADDWVPAILAVGHLPVLVQLPTISILAGLNAHGRAGVARFVASVISVALNVLVLKYLKWGLVGTAIAVTLPLAVLNLLDIPRLICRRVALGVWRYFLAVTLKPVLLGLPFAACLASARMVFRTRPLAGLAWGLAVGGIVMGSLYWRYVVPDRVKARISHLRTATT
jgi:O-antigen/teichoic acid export membrane protein